MRILFTGGSGKAGKHTINYLLEHGHSLLNLDQVQLEHPTIPEDSYAMSKVVNEATAKSFQRRSGIDITDLAFKFSTYRMTTIQLACHQKN